MKDDGLSSVSIMVEEFCALLKRPKLRGSFEVAQRAVLVLREVVSKTRWTTACELMVHVRTAGRQMIAAQPNETAVGCMVRRVLFIIRDEYEAYLLGDDGDSFGETTCGSGGMTTTSTPAREDTDGSTRSLTHSSSTGALSSQPHMIIDDIGIRDLNHYSKPSHGIKGAVCDEIALLLDEITSCTGNIAVQALEHIHENEVIMTFGRSKTVERFLKEAARKRKFHVIAAEAAPFYYGQELAINLASSGIDVTVITDSAAFAMMSRVNKVIIGTHTVMADGGLIALNGSHAVALAAERHSVPVLVLAGIFKLSPLYLCSYDQNTFNNLVAPSDVLRFDEEAVISSVNVDNPVFDFVPPNLVTLTISNMGGHAPSYVYRLLNDHYHEDDYDLNADLF